MNFHKDQGDSLEPCTHMESMLNRTADGSAPKVMELYARSHASRCVRCGNFLTRLTQLLAQLKRSKASHIIEPILDTLSEERWQAVEAKWAEAESA